MRWASADIVGIYITMATPLRTILAGLCLLAGLPLGSARKAIPIFGQLEYVEDAEQSSLAFTVYCSQRGQEAIRSAAGNLTSRRMTSLRIRSIASRIKNNFLTRVGQVDDR
jgi:hypothetical protein